MYVRHTPRYTGFGLGADVPVVTLASVMPQASNPIIPGSPLTIAGYAVSWTELLAAVGVLYVVLAAWSGGKKIHGGIKRSAAARRSKEKRRASLQEQLKALG